MRQIINIESIKIITNDNKEIIISNNQYIFDNINEEQLKLVNVI